MEKGKPKARASWSFEPSLVLFVLAIFAVIFLAGMFVGLNKYFPYQILKSSVNSGRLIFQELGMITGAKPDRHLFLARYSGSGVELVKPDKVSPGLTLISGFFDNGLQIRLIDSGGEVVNRWPVSYKELWSGEDNFIEEGERPKTDWNTLFNGIHVEPDGSILFPLFGLVKLDRCGAVQWRVERNVHHSLEKNTAGHYWVPGARDIRGTSNHPPIRVPYKEHTIVEISNSGKVIQEVSVLDALWQNSMLPTLFANNRDYDSNPEKDVIHLNDVEEIPLGYLDKFPQFSAGDVLLSLRESNMLVVMDPLTLKIKWHQTGPWLQQHDADWQPDGTITVFSNNHDRTTYGEILGGSSILSLDPKTGVVRNLYGQDNGQQFYTSTQGDHQLLENGNILITESNAGRVFEVTLDGELVWEYINRYSENEVVRVPDAVRYPPDYFTVESWKCDQGQ